VIGLSGGIASGKSTVSRLLADFGAAVVDADAIVHELQAPGSALLAEMVDAFGPGILRADGALDRAAMGAIAFRDADARARLGRLVHPRVAAEMHRRTLAGQASGAPLVVLDIPLLFEGRRAGSASPLGIETTVLVWVPVEVQIERCMARDACSREEARRRIDAQMPIDEKRALADHIIDNSGNPAETRQQTRRLFERLVSPPPAGLREEAP